MARPDQMRKQYHSQLLSTAWWEQHEWRIEGFFLNFFTSIRAKTTTTSRFDCTSASWKWLLPQDGPSCYSWLLTSQLRLDWEAMNFDNRPSFPNSAQSIGKAVKQLPRNYFCTLARTNTMARRATRPLINQQRQQHFFGLNQAASTLAENNNRWQAYNPMDGSIQGPGGNERMNRGRNGIMQITGQRQNEGKWCPISEGRIKMNKGNWQDNWIRRKICDDVFPLSIIVF